jgi:general secretion pathway protein G
MVLMDVPLLDYARPQIPCHPLRKHRLLSIAAGGAIVPFLAFLTPLKTSSKSEQARRSAASRDLSVLQVAINAFHQDMGRYPGSVERLGALIHSPARGAQWKGPYITSIPTDPWGNAYAYRPTPAGFKLFSLGSDGKESTGDDIPGK